MPLMNFDLEDDQEPVSFMLSTADSERFMAFMADCTDAIQERQGLLDEQNVHLDRIEQLEKELAQLKQKRTGGGHESEFSPWSVTDEKPWFAYCPGNGIVAFKTEAEATAQAEEFIDDWLDPDTGWDELVDQVFVGRAIQISSQVDRADRPDESEIDEDGCDEDGHYWGGDYEYFCNYKLQPVQGLDQ